MNELVDKVWDFIIWHYWSIVFFVMGFSFLLGCVVGWLI